MNKTIMSRKYYAIALVSYILVCVFVIGIGVNSVRDMISDYNKEQAGMVTGLLVENINAELNNLAIQLEQIADVVLTGDGTDKEKLETLKMYQRQSYFDSIGFLNPSNEFFGEQAERTDLAKLGHILQAINADDIFITDPYRSTISGRYVLTVFVPVNGKGIVYANLDLNQIAVFANESNLNLPANIFMINSKSLNYIACSDTEEVPSGSWNSLMLKKEEMIFPTFNGYNEFVKQINGGIDEGTVSFEISEREYTLGYSSIEKMPNWYIALEIENDELSDTFTKFRSNIYVFMIVLLIATLLYAAFLVCSELIKRREFQKLSTVDPMTGAYNKRSFISLVENYIESKKGRNFGALIFFDVDDFKQYNDKYGHLNGDIVLKTISAKLMEAFESTGYVGRYGGDEFVVFVKGASSKEEIGKKIKAVREQMAETELVDFGKVPVSFSAGGACCPADGLNYEELCNSADKALYQVKESGKGKLFWYQ